jgi:hypothetical protein
MRQWHFGCKLHSWSKLVRTVRAFLIAVIVVVFSLCAFFSLSAHTAPDATARHSTPVDAALKPSAEDGDDMRGTVDLYGNDVSDAVARYRVDATGTPYEVHSPQTEIPKLGSPKT